MGSAQILILIQSFLTFSRLQGLHFSRFHQLSEDGRPRERVCMMLKLLTKESSEHLPV